MFGAGRVLLVTALMAASVGVWASDFRPADWLRKPTPEHMLSVWPRSARINGEEGHAVITCTITVLGYLRDCKVKTESPAGAGFGLAALMLAPDFQFRPATLDGKPVEAAVNIPLGFQGFGAWKGAGGAPPDQTVVASVPWTEAPTYQEVADAFPKGARERKLVGRAVLYCRFRDDGRLSLCRILVEQPAGFGFGGAAMKLSKAFAAPPSDSRGKTVGGLFVQVPFTFPTDMLSGQPSSIGKPIWAHLPNLDDMAANFPAPALAAHVAVGHVMLNCQVGARGRLTDCALKSESPQGMGFGQAALALSPEFQVTIWSEDGLPTVGGRLNVPIRYEGPTPAPAKPTAPLSPGSGG
jgi:TonB family protein